MNEYGNSIKIEKTKFLTDNKKERAKLSVNVRNNLVKDMRDCIVKYKIHNPDAYLFHKINKMGEVILGWYIGDTSTLQKRVRKEKLVVDVHLRIKTPDTNKIIIPKFTLVA